MGKDIVEPGRPQIAVWRMRIARWIPKAANTHSKYVILNAFPLQQWLRERACMLRYTYIACLVECYACISVSDSMFTFCYSRCYVLYRLNAMNTSRRSVKYVLLRTISN